MNIIRSGLCTVMVGLALVFACAGPAQALQPLPQAEMDKLRSEGRLPEWEAVVKVKGIHEVSPHLIERARPKLKKLRNDARRTPLPAAQEALPAAAAPGGGTSTL